jgi:archaellum biogenesis ATPase FlaH
VAEQENSVYWKLVNITSDYLGPAAERFTDRQIRSHLNKNPKKITDKDVGVLIDWMQATVSLLTDDEKMVEEYVSQLRMLCGSNSKSYKKRK